MVECQLPKLDVAGSNPVSRSIFSITYSELWINAINANAVIALNAFSVTY